MTAPLDGLTTGEVEQLGNGMASWVAVNSFGCFISGPAWREGRIGEGDVPRRARPHGGERRSPGIYARWA